MVSVDVLYEPEPARPRIEFGYGESAQHPDLRRLLSYWKRKAGARAMPERGELLPRDMKSYLRYLHMYDVIDGGADFRIRLFGTSLVLDFGFDPTGRLVSEFPDPDAGERLTTLLHRVTRSRAPVRFTAESALPVRCAHSGVEALWLPLGSEERIGSILAISRLGRLARAA